ncbi:hypothetical protein HispidOSU_008067 [Sigmodon hispidus]
MKPGASSMLTRCGGSEEERAQDENSFTNNLSKPESGSTEHIRPCERASGNLRGQGSICSLAQAGEAKPEVQVLRTTAGEASRVSESTGQI